MRNLAANWQNSPNSRSPEPWRAEKLSCTYALPLSDRPRLLAYLPLTVFVNLLYYLLQGSRFDLEAHHGKDVADVVCRNSTLLVGKAVEASLQDINLIPVQTHVILSRFTFLVQNKTAAVARVGSTDGCVRAILGLTISSWVSNSLMLMLRGGARSIFRTKSMSVPPPLLLSQTWPRKNYKLAPPSWKCFIIASPSLSSTHCNAALWRGRRRAAEQGTTQIRGHTPLAPVELYYTVHPIYV